ncbi:myelin-oligodendrocyte glycoprotein-like [Onychostoma macrolepis]|uniref:myelin-oligodendrocyte glycoprotein-like n=1 Tax=Onychostoma macrolepis TaxID=369639 RepID=UPI00272AD3E3|nr:myelin-oligodendrocyte glycoprotein-like [Onychostoma macrolepis]
MDDHEKEYRSALPFLDLTWSTGSLQNSLDRLATWERDSDVKARVKIAAASFKVNTENRQKLLFTVVVPADPVEAHVGSSVILSCWISLPETAEALEIRWYRHDFNKPVLLYNHGKIQDVQECFRNRTSLSLRSDQSGGLKDGDVSLRLEKLTFQDEGPFHCYVSGDTVYDSKVVDLKITGESKTTIH